MALNGQVIAYRCNICGRNCRSSLAQLNREERTCRCRSSVRLRSVIHLLSLELFGRSLALPDFPSRPDLKGIGLSDGVYHRRLARKLGYVNTHYHKKPRLDITAAPDPSLEETLDFLISTEVFEHVAPPVSRAFENAYRLLKPGGVLILTVPYVPEGETLEHFPDLYRYALIKRGGRQVLRNVTREGVEQVYENLVFHGGRGSTLEMRLFSRQGLLGELERAGFKPVRINSEPQMDFGIYWKEPWSLPVVARKPA